MDDAAVVILAGGAATRFPGKLERNVGGEPLLVRVYERVRGRWPVYVAAAGSFAPEIDARLDCTVLVDRWPRRGPLAAFVSACGSIAARSVFAVGGDMPNVGADLLETLARARQPGDEAVVPEHEGRLEPLAALYDRRAVLASGFAMIGEGSLAMHALLDRLTTRRVPCERERFVNVNAPADLEEVR